MQLIEEIEISYFRSFYKFKIRDAKDLNIIFGKNDSGKSNLVRALNLFFSGAPDPTQPFEFPIDFCEVRSHEANQADDVRKFLYVKITFNTPPSFKQSLGERFYVKRQWTVSRGQSYHEEVSNSIPSQRMHILARFLNKIRFIYIPAIKDIRIFEMLLSAIHETISSSPEFENSVGEFSRKLQDLTEEMFQSLPVEVSASTKIGAPTRLGQLFQTLDFETTAEGEASSKSLTRQRGDGIKVRHIPELLSFISKKDRYDYHIWGFEEPENSLDFSAAQSEATRLLKLATSSHVQLFMTTHSPSFYLLNDPRIAKFYVRKDQKGLSVPVQGKELEKFDAQEAIGEGFYLPAVAESIARLAEVESREKVAIAKINELRAELANITTPVVLTEGRTDARLLLLAWDKRRGGQPSFSIRSCETGGENAGSGNGGATSLAIRLKGIASDHAHLVIGLFDYDVEGLTAYKLDRNFVDKKIGCFDCKRGIHGKSYAASLPVPAFRQECKKYKNLPIEFLFRDEQIDTEVDGNRLDLEKKKASTKVGDEKIEIELPGNATCFKDIRGGKTEFANIVAPTFDATAFDGFDQVFAMIEAIIQDGST